MWSPQFSMASSFNPGDFRYMRSKSALTIAAASFLIFETSGAALAAPTTACSLLSQQAAAAISGGPVAPGIGADTGGGDICDFNGAVSKVSVGLIDTKTYGLAPAAVFKIAVNPDPGQTSQPVPGLGETSLFLSAPADSSVAVLYHGKILIVGATDTKNPGLKAALIQAARQILGKL
jgi:hypothetical protein